MQRKTLLIVMVAAGSAMCWWPKIIPPNLGLPGWKTPLILIALVTSLGTALSDEGSRWPMVASVLGGVAGIFGGFKLWWPTDGIDASLVPFSIGLAAFTSIPVSIIAVVAGLALRESKIVTNNRRLMWCAFLICFAFAPTVVCADASARNKPPQVKNLHFTKNGDWQGSLSSWGDLRDRVREGLCGFLPAIPSERLATLRALDDVRGETRGRGTVNDRL